MLCNEFDLIFSKGITSAKWSLCKKWENSENDMICKLTTPLFSSQFSHFPFFLLTQTTTFPLNLIFFIWLNNYINFVAIGGSKIFSSVFSVTRGFFNRF
jgi:hypothetical protein